MNKVIMLVVALSAPVGTERAVTVNTADEVVLEIMEDLLQEPCVWPRCGKEQQYEICLMPNGCNGKR